MSLEQKMSDFFKFEENDRHARFNQIAIPEMANLG